MCFSFSLREGGRDKGKTDRSVCLQSAHGPQTFLCVRRMTGCGVRLAPPYNHSQLTSYLATEPGKMHLWSARGFMTGDLPP
jgi:hypothetical protein